MRSAIITLLAVCSNLTAAGPVRHHERFMQRDLNPRFTNESAIFTTSNAPRISTTVLEPSTLSSYTTESSAQSIPPFVTPPVVGSDGIATQVSDSQVSGLFTTSVKPASNIQASSSDTFNNPITTASVPVSSASAQAAVVQIPAKNTFEFSPVTTTSSARKPLSTIQYPDAQGGNSAMASGFNQIYKSLQMTSSCDPGDSNQAFACISGELAQCQSDGTYVLKSCPMGQSCYALPLSGKTGVSVECAIPSDAAAKLAAQPSSALPNSIAASQESSAVQQPVTSPNAESVSQVPSRSQSPLSGSQAVSNTIGSEPQPTISRQGIGLVSGGINTPPMNTMPTSTLQQQAQTATSSPLAVSEQQNPSNPIALQTTSTFLTASVAKQSQSQFMTLQSEAPAPAASQGPNTQAAEQFSSQAVPGVSKTSQIPDHNPIAQPSSQRTSENLPTIQPVTATSQKVAPTMASQNSENQPHSQFDSSQSASQTSSALQASQNANATPADRSPQTVSKNPEASPTAGGVGGFIFTPMGQQPSASSTPTSHQHQPKPADSSAPTTTPQPPAQAQGLPAAAKDTPPSPATPSNQASTEGAQAPTPSSEGGQFSIIPMGPGSLDKNNNNNSNNNKGGSDNNAPPPSGSVATNEKLVVNPGGSPPLYITVTTTVTTTAYTAAPSA